MITHPDVLAAVRASEDYLGKIPQKYLVCSWEMYRALQEYGQMKAAEKNTCPLISKPTSTAIDVYGPMPSIPLTVAKTWTGMRWKLCTSSQRAYIMDEPLRGTRGEETWNGETHSCCGARVWYRHKKSCHRVSFSDEK